MSTCKIVSLLLALSVTAVSSQSFPFVLNVTSISGNDTLGEIHLYYRVSAILNGNIGDVCSSNGVTDQVANELCRQELIEEGSGFLRVTGAVATPPYNFINGELFSTSYANFACPSDITACTGMQVNNCTGYGGFLTIRCNIRFPECFPGLTILNNVVNSTTPDGAFYETGYPAICTNDARYAPVCSGASLSPRDVSELCLRNIENPFAFFGGFVGAPDGVTALPIDFFREIDVVVTDLSCTTLLNCTNMTMMGKCPNDDYATITCQQVCNDETYQPILYNNYTTIRDGVMYIAGIFQFCLGGTFARICDDGTNVQDLATIGCIQYGYQAGRMLPYNASLYNGSPRGILYFSNYTCNEFGCAQNISFAFNEQCYNNGQKDVAVECYNNSLSCSTEGNVTFYTRISSVINGDTEITTGVAVICINGQYTALCGDTEDFDTDDAASVCQAMGYTSGTVRPSDSLYGAPPLTSGYYSNVTCMSDGSCTAVPSDDPECFTGDLNIILQCMRPAPSASSPTLQPPTITVSDTLSSFIITSTIMGTVTASPTSSSAPTTSTDSNVGLAIGVTVAVLVVVAIVVLIIIVLAAVIVRKSRSGSINF